MNHTKQYFMSEAIRLAVENVRSGNGGPFGAIIVKNGKIIGKGVNKVTSSNDPTAHAEIIAIRDACKNLNSFQLDDCEIYTSCEPCSMCSGLIFLTKISTVVYGAPASYLVDIVPGYKEIGLTSMTKLPDQHVKVRGPILRKAAEKILKDFLEAEKLKRGN